MICAACRLPCSRQLQRWSGYSLVELIVAMSSATLLLAGLGSAVIVTSRAFRPEGMVEYQRTQATWVEHMLMADLRLARQFIERTATAATFTVPDRDGDGIPDRLRYAWSGVSGDPLTLSFNGSQPFTVAENVRNFALNYDSVSVPARSLAGEEEGSTILMIVEDSSRLNLKEIIKITLLETRKYVVVVKGINDGVSSILAQADDSAAVYVCNTLRASNFIEVINALQARPVGIVNEHSEFVDEFGFATGSDSQAMVSTIEITDNYHHITMTQSLGGVSVGSQQSQFWLTGTLASDLNTLGKANSQPALCTIDTGKLRSDGANSAGRRVVLPWGTDSNDPIMISSEAMEMTDRAVQWATGIGNGSPKIAKLGYDTVFPSTTSRSRTQLATQATLTQTAKLRSISAYVGGSNDQVRFAIYSDAGGQPDVLITQSDVGHSGTSMDWVTLTVPQLTLSPGNYWLAILLKHNNQQYTYVDSYPGAGMRNKSLGAFSNGFLPTWGTSNASYDGARSIYATYEVIE